MVNKAEWFAKIKAAAIHFALTLTSALLVWQLIRLWYPGGLAGVLNSLAVYKIVMVVELILGPLMSLVVFSTIKSRRELIKDYLVIGLIQIAALFYGLRVVESARPAYIIFARDRLEIVRPLDLDEKNVAEVRNKGLLTSLFKSTKYLCINFPADEESKKNLLTSVLKGTDIHRLPKYYRECETGELYRSVKDLTLLENKIKINSSLKQEFEQLAVAHHGCGWLRLFAPQGELVAIVCADKNIVKKYVHLNE